MEGTSMANGNSGHHIIGPGIVYFPMGNDCDIGSQRLSNRSSKYTDTGTGGRAHHIPLAYRIGIVGASSILATVLTTILTMKG